MEPGLGTGADTSEKDVEIARAALQPLLTFLKSLSPPDQAEGLEAADIIERHLRLGSTLFAFWSTLGYDIGGKGLQDWGWSSGARTAMQPLLDAASEVIRSQQAAERMARTGK